MDAVGRLKWLKCIHLLPHHSGECAPLTICRYNRCRETGAGFTSNASKVHIWHFWSSYCLVCICTVWRFLSLRKNRKSSEKDVRCSPQSWKTPTTCIGHRWKVWRMFSKLLIYSYSLLICMRKCNDVSGMLHAGCLGKIWTATNGLLQGDPLSVVMLNCVLRPLLSRLSDIPNLSY